jgi:signal peptidase I
MRILKGILHWAPRVLAGLFVALAILIGTGLVNARVVLSDSMEPVFYKNDVVFGLSWVTPQPGDIAIYQERDINGVVQQDVVHRVITVSQAGEYMFKGDNNQSADALMVAKADVRSTVVLSLPGVGSLLSPIGAVVVVGIIGGIWALVYGLGALKRTKTTTDEE